ncbi:MAG: hypothetical protein Q9218_002588 [Villophora microphyllina]
MTDKIPQNLVDGPLQRDPLVGLTLYDALWKQYSVSENYHGQNFLSYETIRQQFSHGRLVRWINERQNTNAELLITSEQLVPIILSKSLLLFALLVLSSRERLFPLLTSFGLKDDNLFDAKSFERISEFAALTDNDKNALTETRKRVGAVLNRNGHRIFPIGTVLPYKDINHPKDDRFGGFGVVRRVEIAPGHLQGYSEKFAALKQVRPSNNDSSEEWDQLYREVETLQRMRHSNIIPLLASYFLDTVGSSDRTIRTLYLLFPWAEMDLEHWMTQPDAPAPVQHLSRGERRLFLYRSMLSLMSALSYLHREHGGLITSHHDLKPSNILVVGQEFMISDLGRSHLRPLDGGSSTEGIKGLGTFEYQPPEYWHDNGYRARIKHGRAFDIWSMGCILVELATLAVYDWRPGMISKFKEERMSNPTLDRPKLAENREDREDGSFHNNKAVVDNWVMQLKQHSGSSRTLEQILDVATAMMAREPRSRLYSWEAEIDLHDAQKTGLATVGSIIEGSFGLQPPAKSIGHDKLGNGAQTPLHRAALREDTKRVIGLLNLRWPIFIQDQDGDTILDIIKRSASKHFREKFQMYLGKGVAATSVYQGTVMLDATEVDDAITIRRLVANGVSPMITDSEGLSCLSLAVTRGYLSAIKTLLQLNVKEQLLLKSSSTGETALHLAVILGDEEIVKTLLEYRPELEDRQYDGKTALYLAVETERTSLVKILLANAPRAQVFTRCKAGNTPLHKAIGCNMELLGSLLDAEDSARCVEHKNHFGETPMWLALRHQDFEAFRLLKERGVSMRTANNDHDNLLHLIARQDLYDFFSQNLAAFDPSDVEGRNRWNDTPLTIADRNGFRGVADLLRSFYTGMKITSMADITETPSKKPKLFYTLGSGQKWIKEDPEGYWRHLTYESYKIYEQIWSLAIGNGGRRLIYTDFIKQFNPSDPRPDTIEYVWRRVLTSPHGEIRSTSHPKSLVLAILYMLHMERFSSERPRGDTNQPGEVKAKRIEILKRFDVWIPYTCRRKCASEWNFVGDLGIYRAKPTVAGKGKCRVIEIVEGYKNFSGSFLGLRDRKQETDYKIWKALLETWKKSKH